MKKTIFKLSLILTGMATFFSSCSKDDSPSASKACMITAQKGLGDTIFSTYEYDNKNRVVKSQYYDDKDTKGGYDSYVYEDNKVISTYTSRQGEKSVITYHLGSNGYVAYSVSTFDGIDTVFYTYDNEGYLIKSERKEYGKNAQGESLLMNTGVTTNTYTNGNKTKSVRKEGSGEYITLYEHYDIPNKADFNPIKFGGKGDKNLRKKYSYPNTGNWTAFTYELNADGLATKVFVSESYDGKSYSENYEMEYSCK